MIAFSAPYRFANLTMNVNDMANATPDDKPVMVTFLLGPAGSGKTWRCIEEARQELMARPEGPPLLFIAPKQATFQLERQLLAGPGLAGYTRLQILSFERLARFCFEGFAGALPPLLSEEGRLMVLRALLVRQQQRLRVFRSVARLPGFAQQLNELLQECQRHRLGPERLQALAGRANLPAPLANKLLDVADLMAGYMAWIETRKLQDAQQLLDLAASMMHEMAGSAAFQLGGLWLDGFTEITPQELELLAAIIPNSARSTLAFCLDTEAPSESGGFETWATVRETYSKCRGRLEAVPGCNIQIEHLKRNAGTAPRFKDSPGLAWLESRWSTISSSFPETTGTAGAGDARDVRFVACANPEAEAVLAAREIRRHVREGGRYREVAVLVRNLKTHAAVLRRVFKRYDIPFFLDQREPVAHHPLVELTRSALRMAAFNWRQEDWFGALKSGMINVSEEEVDWLENEALERGWEGETWQEEFEFDDASQLRQLEALRRRVVPPFASFTGVLRENSEIAGETLAGAIRRLWDELDVAGTLENWASSPAGIAQRGSSPAAVHATVWEQMSEWLENLERAFTGEKLALPDWLAVFEAGVATMTVGVIPPALDQVLVGAVDRSRNPDLHTAVVLGFNEGLLPEPPSGTSLLSDSERELLEQHQAWLGLNTRQRMARERYLAYIACTRACRRLVLAWSRMDSKGDPLNPSPLLANLRRMFPDAPIEEFNGEIDWQNSEHPSELLCALAQADFPFSHGLEQWRKQLDKIKAWQADDALSLDMARRLYGPDLKTSVTALEDYGACPFKFFIGHGLRAEERKYFEIDRRETGSLQHKILEEFHLQLAASGRRWRDITPQQAADMISQIAGQEAARQSHGLFAANAPNQFAVRALVQALQDFITVIIGWMGNYGFDPVKVEWAFGTEESDLPPWILELDNDRRLIFRGKIDRVDICDGPKEGTKLCVVIDYKSSAKNLDPVLLAHGIQMQLPAYLSFLMQSEEAAKQLGAQKLEPAGAFYVALRGKYESGKSRDEILGNTDEVRRKAYQHTGRFNLAYLDFLDRRSDKTTGDQFKFRLTRKGIPCKNSPDPMQTGDFQKLLLEIEQCLKRMGNDIYQGRAAVDPYQMNGKRACDNCNYQNICRIDVWTHQFRILKEPAEEATES